MSSSSDDFPLPAAKRRRLSRNAIPNDHEDSDPMPNAEPPRRRGRPPKTTSVTSNDNIAIKKSQPRKPGPKTPKESKKPRDPKPPKEKKPKHRIVIHEQIPDDVQDLLATQAPEEEDPALVRGAMWHKQMLATVNSNDAHPAGSKMQIPRSSDVPPPLTQVPDHTGVGRQFRGRTSRIRARPGPLAQSSSDEDDEEEAFEDICGVRSSQHSNHLKQPLRIPPSKGNQGPPLQSTTMKKSQYSITTLIDDGTEDIAGDATASKFDLSYPQNSMQCPQKPSIRDTSISLPVQGPAGANVAAIEVDKLLEDWPENEDPFVTSPQGIQSSISAQPIEVSRAVQNEALASDKDEYDDSEMDEALADFDIDKELADLPSDAFESSPPMAPAKPSFPQAKPSLTTAIEISSSPMNVQRVVAPQANLQQRTLFGDLAAHGPNATQGQRQLNFVKDLPPEKPTHHKLNESDLSTYVYPANLGSSREYQYNIVQKGLFSNTLVALPTGLGKTFIAATIMLNWYRWTRDAQIVFVAPTRPLVSQQVEACYKIAGIPKSKTSFMTGGVNRAIRADEWMSKRVFFCTPQIFENDLRTGLADPKRIVLFVVDEAHRAKGNYSYVKVVKLLRQFNDSFRVLALTATPGGDVKAVQEVIDGLDIAKVEIRTEFSIDIRPYTFARDKAIFTFEQSEEMVLIIELFTKAIQPIMDKLHGQNAYWSKDPMSITNYQILRAQNGWRTSPAGQQANPAVKGMVQALFAFLGQLGNPIELLKFHGLGPFYHAMVNFRSENQDRNGKYAKMVTGCPPFQQMMDKLRFWINRPNFVGHPKLEKLQEIVVNHFLDAGQGRGEHTGNGTSATRVMIFAQYRSSAEEIVRVLKRTSDILKPHVFIGQASSKSSEGMDQKRQLEVIEQFKTGTYNVLVATSIGEEGLDIGEIDLIICYDSSASPIRMLQRMGRTGRKRAGRIILLLMQGKEENDYKKAVRTYEDMQKHIAEPKHFNFHEDRSKRIIPREIRPKPDHKIIEIPKENLEDGPSFPKKRGRTAKLPPKRFNMPDGVATGFFSASRLAGDGTASAPARSRLGKKATNLIAVPDVMEVLLSADEVRRLKQQYQDVHDLNTADGIEAPSVTSWFEEQRHLRRTSKVRHSFATRLFVDTMNAMHNCLSSTEDHPSACMDDVDWDEAYGSEIQLLPGLPSIKGTKRKRTAKGQEEKAKPGPKPTAAKVPGPTKKVSRTQSKEATATSKKDAATAKDNKATASKGRGRPKKAALMSEEAGGVECQDAAEGDASSPPASDPRMALLTQLGRGEELGSQDTSGDEEAEEVELSSDMRDFLAPDDEDFGELPSSIPLTQPVKRKRLQRRVKLFDSDDENADENGAASGESGVEREAARRKRSGAVIDSSSP